MFLEKIKGNTDIDHLALEILKKDAEKYGVDLRPENEFDDKQEVLNHDQQ